MSIDAIPDDDRERFDRERRLSLLIQRVEAEEVVDFPALQSFGLTSEAVERINRALERYQTRHAIYGIVFGIAAIVSGGVGAGSVLTSSSAWWSAAYFVGCVASLVAAAYCTQKSHAAESYWRRFPEQYDTLRFYERWHQVRGTYALQVQAREAERRRSVELHERRRAQEADHSQRVDQSMASIDQQFQDTLASRHERLKLVPVEPIRNSRHLSELFAGIDDDVKVAFANLSPTALCALMIDYESAYGVAARRLAERTWRMWSLGEVDMSAEIVQRLLAMVPKFMSQEERYELLKKVREKYQPALAYRDIFCRSDELRDAVLPVVAELVSRSSMVSFPESLVDRVEWLLDGDSVAAQKLLTAIEAEEAERRVAHLEEEFRNIERVLREMPGKGSFVHRIDLPQGAITVTVIRPRRDFLQRAKRLIS